MSSHAEFQLPITFLTYDVDPYSKYKDLDNTPQDHSSVTIINQFCLLESDEGMF